MGKVPRYEFNVTVRVTGTDSREEALAAWLQEMHGYPFPYQLLPGMYVEMLLDRRHRAAEEKVLADIELEIMRQEDEDDDPRQGRLFKD